MSSLQKNKHVLLNVMPQFLLLNTINITQIHTCICKEILKRTIIFGAWWIFVNYLPIRNGSSTKSGSWIFCVCPSRTHIHLNLFKHTYIYTWIHHNWTLYPPDTNNHTIHPPTQNNHLHHTLEYNLIIVIKWKKQITNKDT